MVRIASSGLQNNAIRWRIARRTLATEAKVPQTVIEKIVQRHAVGLPSGKTVKAGDYVMIKPQHVMTHVSLHLFDLFPTVLNLRIRTIPDLSFQSMAVLASIASV